MEGDRSQEPGECKEAGLFRFILAPVSWLLHFLFASPRTESYILFVRCVNPMAACEGGERGTWQRRSPSHFLATPAATTPRPVFFFAAFFAHAKPFSSARIVTSVGTLL